MTLTKIIVVSCVLGLILSGIGAAAGIIANVGPDSVGNTFLGYVAGFLCVFHMWIWASVTGFERFLPPPRGPVLDTSLLLAIPLLDWALVIFVILWLFRGKKRKPKTNEDQWLW